MPEHKAAANSNTKQETQNENTKVSGPPNKTGEVKTKARRTESKRKSGQRRGNPHQVPAEILEDEELKQAITILPKNYNFEIYKTVWRLRKANATMVALQFPEGLLMYACLISDLLERFCKVTTLIMGDVTYGGCCVDDLSARALGCDFFVHYGHSCLVPITVTTLNILYVFVDIKIDLSHFIESFKHNFKATDTLMVAGTIQFASSLQAAKRVLSQSFPSLTIPQAKPLSRGEVLGCTSPELGACDALVFLADGRFHLESIMIQNPHIKAFYKYDPYSKRLTKEQYDHEQMQQIRKDAIDRASSAKRFGLILGTLGRQGSPHVLKSLEDALKERKMPYQVVLLSEIFPGKLAQFSNIDAWIQIACPRLSIDWGYAFEAPLLSPYEAMVCLKKAEWRAVYPMDFYRDSGGAWTNYHYRNKDKKKQGKKTGATRKLRSRKTRVVISYDKAEPKKS